MPSISASIVVDDGSYDPIVIEWQNERGRNRISRSRIRSRSRRRHSIPPQEYSREREARARSRARERSRQREQNPFGPFPDHSRPIYGYPDYEMRDPYPHVWHQPPPGIYHPEPIRHFPNPLPSSPGYNSMEGPRWPPRRPSPEPIYRRNPFEPLSRRRSPSPVALTIRPRRPSLHRPRAPRLGPPTYFDLDEHPRDVTFPTENALLYRMINTYRPLVGIVRHIVEDRLRLGIMPAVKFDMYAVHINSATGGVMITSHASGRAPIFCITLPYSISPHNLQAVTDALKTSMEARHSPWYRQVGYLFRVSRDSRRPGGRDNMRYWLPPACVYRLAPSANGRDAYYRPRIRSPAPSQVQELAHTQVFDDESGDDDDEDDTLVDGMRRIDI